MRCNHRLPAANSRAPPPLDAAADNADFLSA